MASRRRQAQLAVAFAGGGIPAVRAKIRRKVSTPARWFRAARTHPIQTFAVVTFLYLWNSVGNLILALLLTAIFVGGGVTLWFEYRRRNTGLTYQQAAKQIRMQKKLNAQWNKACYAAGLTAKAKGNGGKDVTLIPPLTKVTAVNGDLTARIYTGQYAIPTADVAKNLRRIADATGSQKVSMRVASPGVVDLRFCYTNPLEKTVKPAALTAVPKGNIPFGVTADGAPITIPVINADGETEFRSTLIGGVSGGGKSSALWAILAGFIAQEVPVRLRVSDAAGGVELWQLGKALEQNLGTSMFRVHRYAEDKAGTDAIIKEMLADMNERLDKMRRAEVRKHKPTPEEPMDILVIDEMILIKSLIKAGSDSDLGQMLSVCRKAAFGVIACTQLTEKLTLGEVRELLPMRIAFRMNTRPQTVTILGDDQAEVGPAHEIPRSQPGVGYMYDQATDTMTEFRAVHITDVMAKQIAQGVAPEGMENYGKEPQEPEKPRCVYWHYGYPDPVTGGRELWYVGSADNPDDRFKQHEKDRKSRRWWKKTDHSARRIEWYPTQAEGYAAEEEAIKRDKPRYNDLHNRENPARLTHEPAEDYEVAA